MGALRILSAAARA